MKREMKITKVLPLSALEKNKLTDSIERMLKEADLPFEFKFSHIDDCKGACIFDDNTFNVTFVCKHKAFVNLYGYVIDIRSIRFYVQKCFGLVKQINHSYKYSNEPIYRLYIEVDGTEKELHGKEERIVLGDNFQERDNMNELCIYVPLLDLKRRLEYL